MIFVASFCCFWDFLLEVLKLKKNLWLRPLERLDKYYFQKKNSKYEIINNLYFGSNFVFYGTAIGRFSQCFFLIFRRRPTIVADIFTQAPHHKKASYDPVYVYWLPDCPCQNMFNWCTRFSSNLGWFIED